MASARNLCQHSDNDGTQCTSNDYILCPHCQLQLCLKHLNYHQELLRSDLYNLCDDIDHVRMNLDSLVFDSTNQRDYLLKQLDQWYSQGINYLKKTYAEKKQEIQILYIKSRMEFDVYKDKKEKQLKENLIKQLNKVLKQKQIHIDDLNNMKTKLDYIQRGLNELKQLNIDIQFNTTNFDINIIKKRYIEAAKPLFNDDDNDIWDLNDDDDDDEIEETKLQIPADIDKSSDSIEKSILLSLETVKKPPLKLVIKRLQHSTRSARIKYELHTVNTSVPIIT